MLSEDIARKLLQINAIRLNPQNPFTWASGIRAPVYCDNRLILSYPALRTEVAGAFVSLSQDYAPFDCIAGVATAGIPHGVLVAHIMSLPFVYVRASAKDHGRQNKVEGLLEPGTRVLVIEDLISTGGSSLAAVDVVRNAGCEVVAVLAIFQYNFPETTARFEHAGCAMDTLTEFNTLIRIAKETGAISDEDILMLGEWSQAPNQWNPHAINHS